MESSSDIAICLNPRDTKWGLGILPQVGKETWLIGWRQNPPSFDAGVPGEIGAVLAGAFTKVGTVTFFCTPRDLPPASDNVSALISDRYRLFKRNGWADRLFGWLRREPAEICLFSTHRPVMAARMFEIAAFPWSLQGQVGLLSIRTDQPLFLNDDILLRLLDADWTTASGLLATLPVDAVIQPGVDGDVAGILLLNNEIRNALLRSLEVGTINADMKWMVLTEDEFSSWLAGQTP